MSQNTPVLIIDACQFTANYNNCLLDALAGESRQIIYATTVYPYAESPVPPEVKTRYCFFYLARLLRRVTSSNLVRRVLRAIEYPVNLFSLIGYILIKRIRVVHFMWVVSPALDLFAMRILRCLGCRIVYTAHDPFPHEEKPSDLRRYSNIYHQVDKVIALTDFTRNEIVSRCGLSAEKMSVIPHGDFNYIMEQYTTNETLVKKVRQQAGGRRVISFLGLIRLYKGLDYFIRAMPLIKSLKPDTFFLVAGSARFVNQRRVEQLLKENCSGNDRYVDLRYLPISDMKAYLAVTDVLVLPYISGTSQSGNTVMAYSYGIPVICTNIGGLAEMVEDGCTGYVVPAKDPQAIAEAVAKCLTEDNLARMSDVARTLAAERYNWTTIAAQTIEVYRQLSEMEKIPSKGKYTKIQSKS